ncbi:hypothetical protein DL96DRAFT_1574437 [Flagelloscypha sp. PMI_526]|nr:hypothetical protein DL96DRAFT_1574437 [Flagelloscypha sp. PMI_526]
MPNDSDLPLPFGWVKQVDPATNHAFWVDTKAQPPRSIWVHPYYDPQFLSEHPEVRATMGSTKPVPEEPAPEYTPDPIDMKSDGYYNNSWAGDFKNPNPDRKSMAMGGNEGGGHGHTDSTHTPTQPVPAQPMDASDPKGKKKQKTGLFGKLKKDKPHKDDVKKIEEQRIPVNMMNSSSSSSSSTSNSYTHTYSNVPLAGYPGAGFGPTQPNKGYESQQHPQQQQSPYAQPGAAPQQSPQPYPYPPNGASPAGYPQQGPPQGYFAPPPQGVPYGYGPQGYHPQQQVFQGPYGPPQGQYGHYGQPMIVQQKKSSSGNGALAVGAGLLGGLLLGDLLF